MVQAIKPYKNIYIHTYIYTYIHTYTHIHTYVRTYLHTYIHTYIHTYLYKQNRLPEERSVHSIYIYIYNFGRVFLMLNYIAKPQNTYIQSWTVWEIRAIENCGLPLGPRTTAVRWCSYQLLMPTGGGACERTYLRWFREMHGGWFIQCTSWYENAKPTHPEAARQACYVTIQHSSMMYSTSNRK
jgi:hypothetical protein